MKPALHLLAPILPLLLAAAAPEKSAATYSLPTRPLELQVGRWAAAPAQRVFESREEFEGYFEQRALGVDFNREWVVLYAAGAKLTTGYVASIDEILRTENEQSLKINTSLAHPGRSCPVQARRSMPYAIAVIPAMRTGSDGPGVIRFSHADTLKICN
jgi:hypothetical protein